MFLTPIPAFDDNYLWMLDDGRRALIVDPGDAAPVLQALQDRQLQLQSILVTHHHPDHTGGVDALRQATGAGVFGPAREHIPGPFTPLQDGDKVQALGLDFQVLDVPGHTAGHIAYYLAPTLSASRDALPPEGAELARGGPSLRSLPPTLSASRDALPPEGAHPAWGGPAPDGTPLNGRPLLFCGDTLFSGGCGRLFEGTPAQMLASLDRLAALPGNTVVCCTHEYTMGNLRFALAVEPDNKDLIGYHAHCAALRQAAKPTLPTSIAQELLINPFLRTRHPTVMAAARRFDPAAHDDNTLFAAIRQWKNQFK